MLRQLDVLIGFVVVMSIVSMAVTVINQMILSGFQLRGRNLRDGLIAMFATVAPEMTNTHALAEVILRHPILSDSQGRGKDRGLASAIRPQELVDILEKIEKEPGPTVQLVGEEFLTKLIDANQDKATALQTAASTILNIWRNPNADVSQAIQNINTLAEGLAPEAKQKLIEQVSAIERQVGQTVQNAIKGAEKWFGMVEDRSREWFATHAQIATSIISVAVVLALQLDAIELYKRVSTDDQFRAQLVASSASVQSQAQDITQRASKAESETNKEVVTTLKEKYKGTDLGSFLDNKLDARPNGLLTDAKAASWLRSKLGDDPKSTTVINDYNSEWSSRAGVQFEGWKNTLTQLKDTAQTLDGKIASSSFQIIPAKYPTCCGQWFGVMANGKFNIRHFLGMALFAALLSLGTPYWFNILKTLTSFRPLLAQEVEKDQNAAAQTGDANKTSR